MAGRRTLVASALILVLILPMAASSFMDDRGRGGYDAAGDWRESVELPLHYQWWMDWSRDKDLDSIDDRLEWLLEQPVEFQEDWWRRAPAGHARVFVDYDHHPSDADVRALERLGVEVTFRATYLDTLAATIPIELIHEASPLFELSGLVMLEDLGLAEPHMNEANPNMGVNEVWETFGFDGTGVTIAVLDTGVRGDHEGLNDMDDDPFTCVDDPPDPLDPNPDPIPADCDPKVKAFYDAVYTDSEQPASESFDSGTHGTHVAGIAAGSGGGQTAPDGSRYIGTAPGAWVINILACCEGDIEDIIEGAQWAIDNKDRHGIDIVTSSLGEQQFEVHFDNDGSSAWSRQMDAVADSGIITTLSAGNEFGGATVVGCNTIDSPGDANLPVTVASLDKDLGLAIYSSRGYTSDGRVKPDISTIGSSIMAPDAATKDGYTSKSGTSMATPLMAGIAALMKEANPDLTHADFKDILAAHAIEREISLGDPGLNDCSLLETRPDNEFGYGQADPLAFVQAAGSIDPSLNVSMDITTMQEIGNESYIRGTASGAAPGMGVVQVRVGGGEWQGAADLSKDGDWSAWNIKLDPFTDTGNSTIYARLVVSDDSVSPVDARRVVLLDGEGSGASLDSMGTASMGPISFFIPFLLVLAILSMTAYREQWQNDFELSTDGFFERLIEIQFWKTNLIKYNPLILLSLPAKAKDAWFDGTALTENKFRRFTSLCVLYFAQGLPWGFTSVTFVAYLAANGATPADIAALFATIALPWTFKWIWGPVIDLLQIPMYGGRRLWILFAQFGMALTIGTLLFIPDLNGRIAIVTALLYIHTIFASLQDVATDALAVDVLQPDEVAKANGFMFAAKRGGIIVGGAVLGVLVSDFGIKTVLGIQLPLLLLIMLLPMFLYEKPGTKLFPWSKKFGDEDEESDDDVVEAEIVEAENLWERDDEWKVAGIVGRSLFEGRVSLGAAMASSSLVVWVVGFFLYIMTMPIPEPSGDVALTIFNAVGLTSSSLTFVGGLFLVPGVLLVILENFGSKVGWIAYVVVAILGIIRGVTGLSDGIPFIHLGLALVILAVYTISRLDIEVPNPFTLLKQGSRHTIAVTSYNLTKAFSIRSALLLIGLCLLSELYLFVDPIVVDIFINEAGWPQAKYNAIVGGVVVFAIMIGQIIGGILGDKYGVRRVAMIGFTGLGLANAVLGLLEPVWTDTSIMTAYLILRGFINGIAWICVISVSMRLTWSEVGGTQFTAFMSCFNLSAVIAYGFTEKMVSIFDYVTSIYIGAALTMVTVVLLTFIDVDETDRVLEGRLDDEGDDEGDDGDGGWWTDEGESMEGADLGEHAAVA